MPSLIERIQATHPTKKLEIWFQDEARFGQQGTLTRIWAKTGSRPRVLCDFGFKSAYIFGAICPALKKCSAMVFSNVGKEETTIHLKKISEELSKDAHALIIMDQAPWHKAVTVPENITIVYLPPYSPELNPTEQVWDLIRSNYLSHRVYKTISDVFNSCCDAWNKFSDLPDVISSIGMRSWIRQN